jgi:uncharacterized membrane protein YgaE (UPF0421/DUF939 family)
MCVAVLECFRLPLPTGSKRIAAVLCVQNSEEQSINTMYARTPSKSGFYGW